MHPFQLKQVFLLLVVGQIPAEDHRLLNLKMTYGLLLEI